MKPKLIPELPEPTGNAIMTELMAAVGVEAVDEWLAAHDAEIRKETNTEISRLRAELEACIQACREFIPQAKGELDKLVERSKSQQSLEDRLVLRTHAERQSLASSQWSRGRYDGLIESVEVLTAAWAKAHPEEGERD